MSRKVIGFVSALFLCLSILVYGLWSLEDPDADNEQDEFVAAGQAPSASVQYGILREERAYVGVIGREESRSYEVGGDAGERYLTRPPATADGTFEYGSVVAEINYRPVILLRGEIPSLRDLGPGDVGRDVEQLQRGLIGLGYSIGDDLGAFGPSTGKALIDLYEVLGYDVRQREPVDEETLRENLAEAAKAVEAAKRELAIAELTLVRHREFLATTLDDARTDYNQVDQETKNALSQASRAVDDLDKDGVPNEALGLVDARASLESAQLARERNLGAGADAIADAELAIERIDESAEARSVDDARRALADANALLASSKQRLDSSLNGSGPFLPSEEVLFAPGDNPSILWPREYEPGASLNDLSGELLIVSTGTPVVEVTVTVGDDIEEDDTVELQLDGGQSIDGRVLRVETRQSGDSTSEAPRASRVAIVEPLGDIGDVLTDGSEVPVVREVARTPGPVLYVPIEAFVVNGEGMPSLWVATGERVDLVQVEPGFSANGFVAIEGVTRDLAEHDLVITAVAP